MTENNASKEMPKKPSTLQNFHQECKSTKMNLEEERKRTLTPLRATFQKPLFMISDPKEHVQYLTSASYRRNL
jgi:hypothetical protein